MNRRRMLTLTLAIVLTACGGGFIRSFRIALASSRPLVDSLVAAKAIPESKASAIIADFDAGAQCGIALQEEFAAIANAFPKNSPRAKEQKFAASSKAFRCFRAVIDRRNFALHPRLQQVANIADGILASLVVFYSDRNAPSQADAAATISATSEQDLERQMESQMKALEKAMKP